MRYKVVLSFFVDATEEEAWDIADGLEAAARRRNYLAAAAFVEPVGVDGVLGTEDKPVSSSAVKIEPAPGNEPMAFGGPDGLEMITLGDFDGRSR